MNAVTVAPDLANSILRYEVGLRARFGADFDEDALAEKHKRMAADTFLFLRATCWRWAECATWLCDDLMNAPLAPSVGDAHAGNFGLWFDAEARLVWGVNDFDEAARLPYTLDLVRLAASLVLVDSELEADDVARRILKGYAAALSDPAPFILDGRHDWLRTLFVASVEDRREFWKELQHIKSETPVPVHYAEPLIGSLQDDVSRIRLFSHPAGTGSRGRPRFAAIAHWRGGPLAMEIKGSMPSCWTNISGAGLATPIATGRFRAPDPSYRMTEAFTLRRLAPNNRKLKFKELRRNLRGRLIEAMGADLAAVHAGEADSQTIADDLSVRSSRWLADAADRVASWTREEHRDYRQTYRSQSD